MVYNPKIFTDKITRSPMTPTPVNKPSARRPLYILANILDVKNETAIRQFGDGKSKRREIKSGTTP